MTTRNRRSSQVESKRGFTLVEVMVGVGILGIVGLATAQLLVQASQANRQQMVLRSALTAKLVVERLLQSTKAQNETVSRNAANSSSPFYCIKENTPCTETSSGYPFALYDDEGTLILPVWQDTSTAGLDLKGAPCTTYGSGQCLFRYDLRWYPECIDAASCIGPLVRIVGRFEYKVNGMTTSMPMNTALYDVDVTVGGALNTVKDHCTGLGGVYNPENNTCRPAQLEAMDCPPNQIVRSIASDGTVICGPYIDARCGGNQYITGITAAGNLQCTALSACATPTPTPAPPIDFCSLSPSWSSTTASGNTTSRGRITLTQPTQLQIALRFAVRGDDYTPEGTYSLGAAFQGVNVSYSSGFFMSAFLPEGGGFATSDDVWELNLDPGTYFLEVYNQGYDPDPDIIADQYSLSIRPPGCPPP